MVRLPVCLTLLLPLTLAGCSNDSGFSDYETAGFRGDVELRSCTAASAEPALLRCGVDAASGIIAAVCGDLEAHNAFTVNAGSLAVSGHSRIAAPLHVNGGSFTSFAGIEADNTQDVTGDLATAGDWVVRSPAHVGGDAFVGGRLEAPNTVDVQGVLHVAPADMTNVSAGSISAADTEVANPLACDVEPITLSAIHRIEVEGVVDLGNALARHSERARVSLGCARYRFTSLGIDNELVIHVSGRTVIVVDGDVRVASPMRVELEPNASLDFLVGGSLRVDNTLSFVGGSTWLAIGGDVRIASPVELAGVLYAPRSSISVDNTLDVTGAALLGPLRVASPVTMTGSLARALPSCSALAD